MSEVKQVMNPVVRYQLEDRENSEFLTDVGTPKDIYEQLFTEEEIKDLSLSYLSMDDAMSIAVEKKNVKFIPIHEIETCIHGSTSNLYNFTSTEVTLNSPTSVNTTNISPLHINGQLITHIEFIGPDLITTHKYFYNTGDEYTPSGLDISFIPNWYNLVVKEKFIPEDKGHIQYDINDRIMKIILDGKEYVVQYIMHGIRILDECREILSISKRISNEDMYIHLKVFLKNIQENNIVEDEPDPQITNIPLICLDDMNDIDSSVINSAIKLYSENRNKLCTFNSRYISDNRGFASLENNRILCDINSYHFHKDQSDEDNMITITLEDANKLNFDITAYSAYFKLKNTNDSKKWIEAIFLLENN